MGKGDRRRKPAKAKKNQAAFAEAVALAEVPKRQPNGQRRQRADAPNDARKVALNARCKVFGLKPCKDNRERLSGQHLGAQLGMVMQHQLQPHEIPRLWATWQGFAMAERTYRLRYLGQSGTAKGASIAMVRERFETDQSHSVDPRSQEDRDRDAVSNWMRWRGYVGCLPFHAQTLLHDLEKGREGALWGSAEVLTKKGRKTIGLPTKKGLDMLEAIRLLADVVERK